jgi:hypothetical protein
VVLSPKPVSMDRLAVAIIVGHLKVLSLYKMVSSLQFKGKGD